MRDRTATERAGASESNVTPARTIEVVTNYNLSLSSAKMPRAERLNGTFFDIKGQFRPQALAEPQLGFNQSAQQRYLQG
jgi:hypothetical protein